MLSKELAPKPRLCSSRPASPEILEFRLNGVPAVSSPSEWVTLGHVRIAATIGSPRTCFVQSFMSIRRFSSLYHADRQQQSHSCICAPARPPERHRDDSSSPVRRSNETAPAGELRPLIRTPDGGGVFQPGVPALDTAKQRRVQVS
jgi:hypothetical protein